MNDTTSPDITAWFAQLASYSKVRAKAGLFTGPKKVLSYLDSIPKRTSKIINAHYGERLFYLDRAFGDLAAGRRVRGLVRRRPICFKEWNQTFGDIWIAGRTCA